MPYNVNFTDSDTKQPVTVYDNTSNQDTSLDFPGRNVTGYGQIIAENFLHLLENFASPQEPVNPVEGQLWYESSTGTLNIFDNTSWKSSSGIQKSPTAPSVSADKVGEVWVDTVKQQLYIWSGATWVLVGPDFSNESGLRTGPIIESISDSDNNAKRIVKFLVDEVPVAIVSKDSFTPKIVIPGFSTIRSGFNVSAPTGGDAEVFDGGYLPKINGISTSSDALTIDGTNITSGKFLRSDIVNTTEYGLNIRNNAGITIGADGNFRISSSVTSSKIYNGTPGSSIDIQVNREGVASTTVRIIDDKVGINVLSPQQALEVDGNIALTGNLLLSNTDPSTNFSNGSLRTAGGAAISKNLLVGAGLAVIGTTTLQETVPTTTLAYNLGSLTKRWNTVHAETIQADFLNGVLVGDVAGNARTATNLRTVTTFQLAGDVSSTNVIQFDGSFGGTSKIFNTTLTANIIEAKATPFPNVSKKTDYVLVFRAGTGLLKESRDTYVGDLGVPIGAIMPFAGVNVPYGYLLCDGSEIERTKYSDLYDVIGNYYGATIIGVNSFRLPDLRGRFPLGRDNMDNGGTVPNADGGYLDAGGGPVNRVSGTAANTLGGSGGDSTESLTIRNLPDHEHTMRPEGSSAQFNAVRIDTAVVPGVAPGPDRGPSSPGQAQYLNSSGKVKTTVPLGESFSVMNPYLTLNYIIRSGPPAF